MSRDPAPSLSPVLAESVKAVTGDGAGDGIIAKNRSHQGRPEPDQEIRLVRGELGWYPVDEVRKAWREFILWECGKRGLERHEELMHERGAWLSVSELSPGLQSDYRRLTRE